MWILKFTGRQNGAIFRLVLVITGIVLTITVIGVLPGYP
jgi:hypothetical protein